MVSSGAPPCHDGSVQVLVLGGYGAVGGEVVRRLRAQGHTALAAGRDPARADVRLDLRAGDGYRAALDGVDVVVNAAGAEDPMLATFATEAGAAFVEISANSSYIAALEQIPAKSPIIVNVGLAPGLTSLLAVAAHESAAEKGPIDIAIVLGAGEQHGAAAVEWTYGLLGRTFTDADGTRIRNFTRPKTFEIPGLGTRRLYRADFSDQHALTRDLGVPVRTYLATDSRTATMGLALATRIPGAARFVPRRLPLPGSDRWVVAAGPRDGSKSQWAHGYSESTATAIVAVRTALAARRLAPGVHQLATVLALAEVIGEDGALLE